MTALPARGSTADAVRLTDLRLASTAAAAHPADGSDGEPVELAWDFPPLPTPIADAVAAAWGVRVVSDPAASDPRSHPAFGVLFAHARSEQVVSALASRTNLVLPAASALIVGDGLLAETIARTLVVGGTRVVRAIDDPIARLRAHLEGVRLAPATADAESLPSTDLVIATGEGHAPLDAAVLAGVSIDASVGATPALRRPTAGTEVRASVHRLGERSWIVDAPDVYETARGAIGPTRTADLLVALSVLRARTDEPDALLAELVAP